MRAKSAGKSTSDVVIHIAVLERSCPRRDYVSSAVIVEETTSRQTFYLAAAFLRSFWVGTVVGYPLLFRCCL